MKKVEILGTGCPKCKKLYEITLKTIKECNIDAEVTKVEDIQKILDYGVMMTPALVVDGEVRVSGKIPKIDELKTLLQ